MLVLGGSQRKGHSTPVLPNRTISDDRMFRNSALSSTAATSHVWLLSTRNVASGTEKMSV